MFEPISTDDETLVALLKKGNVDALKEIHNKYYNVLFRHAYHRLPDKAEVEDLIQELFLHLWNNHDKIVFETSFAAYLFTSVRNKILNLYKHQKVKEKYVASLNDFMLSQPVMTDEVVRTKQLSELINHEIAKLPPQMRLVFEKSRYAQLSNQEIAEELDISINTVKKQISNSLKILRVKLGPYIFSLFF